MISCNMQSVYFKGIAWHLTMHCYSSCAWACLHLEGTGIFLLGCSNCCHLLCSSHWLNYQQKCNVIQVFNLHELKPPDFNQIEYWRFLVCLHSPILPTIAINIDHIAFSHTFTASVANEVIFNRTNRLGRVVNHSISAH